LYNIVNMTKNMFKKYYPKKKVGKDLTKKINTVLKKHGIGKSPQMKHHVTTLDNLSIPDVGSAIATLYPAVTVIHPSGGGTPIVAESLLPFLQGDQYDNRYGGTIEGANICCRYVHIKGHAWTTTPASGPINPEVRFVLVWDTDPSHNVDPAELLYIDTAPLTNAAQRTTGRELLYQPNIYSPININNKKTFTVLMDKSMVLTNAGFKDNVREFDWKIDLKQVTASFGENNTGVNAMLTQNRDLQLFIFCRQTNSDTVYVSAVIDVAFTQVL